jgi:hypothetical protein
VKASFKRHYFIISLSPLPSALEPDKCQMQKGFWTFRFNLSLCENLWTVKEIYFGAVEWCH